MSVTTLFLTLTAYIGGIFLMVGAVLLYARTLPNDDSEGKKSDEKTDEPYRKQISHSIPYGWLSAS